MPRTPCCLTRERNGSRPGRNLAAQEVRGADAAAWRQVQQLDYVAEDLPRITAQLANLKIGSLKEIVGNHTENHEVKANGSGLRVISLCGLIPVGWRCVATTLRST